MQAWEQEDEDRKVRMCARRVLARLGLGCRQEQQADSMSSVKGSFATTHPGG